MFLNHRHSLLNFNTVTENTLNKQISWNNISCIDIYMDFLSCVCVCVTRTRICACMYLHKTCIMCLPYSCMNCMLVCFKGSFIELENVELTSDKITCIDKWPVHMHLDTHYLAHIFWPASKPCDKFIFVMQHCLNVWSFSCFKYQCFTWWQLIFCMDINYTGFRSCLGSDAV
jgi:hypothetical protein